jgi:hypothetical protein
VSAVTAEATWTGEKVDVRDPVVFVARLRKAKWGVGQVLTVRVEPQEDAYTYEQLQHYWGHVVTPLSEWNGDFKDEWDLRLKLDFMPVDPETGKRKTSIKQLNRVELRDYIQRCEVYAHTAHPEAFAVVGDGR